MIDKGVRSGKLKALVVRIDSPGGSVTGSERIRSALLAARAANIPVVASMGKVAASGGYWVSTAATRILAEPATITGSIGVFGVLPSFQGSLEKLGLGVDDGSGVNLRHAAPAQAAAGAILRIVHIRSASATVWPSTVARVLYL